VQASVSRKGAEAQRYDMDAMRILRKRITTPGIDAVVLVLGWSVPEGW
jgi:hypothetical protein